MEFIPGGHLIFLFTDNEGCTNPGGRHPEKPIEIML